MTTCEESLVRFEADNLKLNQENQELKTNLRSEMAKAGDSEAERAIESEAWQDERSGLEQKANRLEQQNKLYFDSLENQTNNCQFVYIV